VIAVALEYYFNDHGAYPAIRNLTDMGYDLEAAKAAGIQHERTIELGGRGLAGLTTPFAYLDAAVLTDPFAPGAAELPYLYATEGERWLLISAGPDGDYDVIPVVGEGGYEYWEPGTSIPTVYMPQRGTLSTGDILRTEKGLPAPSRWTFGWEGQ